MSECVNSVCSAENNQVKEAVKLADLDKVECGQVDEKGDGPGKLDHESEKTVCEGICADSKDDSEVAPSQNKRKSLDDGEREKDEVKKARKDEDDKTEGSDDAEEKGTEEEAGEDDADGAGDEAASDEPVS